MNTHSTPETDLTGNDDPTARLSPLSAAELHALEEPVQFFETRHGARLAFHEYGDPAGAPMVFFHGAGSHVHGMLLHRPARDHGYRIIAPDRPGIGHSAFRPGWTLLEYARDMGDLADHLGIGQFLAVGVSGGGPTLMATAFALPERLRGVVALACVMPVAADPEQSRDAGASVRFTGALAARLPLALFQWPYALLGLIIRHQPRLFARLFASSLGAADQAIFGDPDYQRLFARDFQETFRQGARGPAYDIQTFHKPWGFSLRDIKTPTEAFQGAADRLVPPSFGQYLVTTAPHVRLHTLQGQGHLGHLAHGYRLFERIAARFPAPPPDPGGMP